MKKGFTLIELIIVIVIIGILAMIAIPRYFANIQSARRAEALASMSRIREAEQGWAAINTTAAATTYTQTFPITVDINGDGTNDITLADPSSADFTYTISGTVNTANIQAARGTTGDSYAMCLSSGALTTCAAAGSCSPAPACTQ